MTLIVDPGALDPEATVVEGMQQVADGIFTIPVSSRPKLLGPFVLRPGEKTKLVSRISARRAVVTDVGARIPNPAFFEVTASQITAGVVPLTRKGRKELHTTEGAVPGGVTLNLQVPASR